jgi:hypothetical protein
MIPNPPGGRQLHELATDGYNNVYLTSPYLRLEVLSESSIFTQLALRGTCQSAVVVCAVTHPQPSTIYGHRLQPLAFGHYSRHSATCCATSKAYRCGLTFSGLHSGWIFMTRTVLISSYQTPTITLLLRKSSPSCEPVWTCMHGDHFAFGPVNPASSLDVFLVVLFPITSGHRSASLLLSFRSFPRCSSPFLALSQGSVILSVPRKDLDNTNHWLAHFSRRLPSPYHEYGRPYDA